MSAGNPRRPRVAKAIRDVLSELVAREVHDPRVHKAGLLSVNHVELNRDMSVAYVYVAFLGADDKDSAAAIQALQGASGFLRGPLGRALQLQRTPELRFFQDESSEFGVRLSEIVRSDQARKADDDGEQS